MSAVKSSHVEQGLTLAAGPDDSLAWGYVHAGVRPSTLLSVGACLTLLGPLLALWSEAQTAAWVVWGASLVLVGLGFLLSGIRQWFSFLGVVVGLFYLAHAACMIVALSGDPVAGLAYRMVAVPKLLSLILLVPATRKCLAPHRRALLGVAGAVGAAKVALRAAGVLPEQGVELVDLAVNALVALAILAVSRGLRRRENEWAHRAHLASSASFDDFNRR